MQTTLLPLPAATLALTLLALTQPALHAAFTLDEMKKNPSVDFTIITEMTDAGRALPALATRKPVYYILHFPQYMGQRDTGEFQKQFAAAVAYNGFRPADTEHPATQVFFLEWGAYDKIQLSNVAPYNSDKNPGSDKSAKTSSRDDLLVRAKLLGGQKYAGELAQALKENNLEGFAMRDGCTETFVYMIYNGCRYLTVSSYDFEMHKKNQKKLLWVTAASSASQKLSPDAIPASLIFNMGYFFGRESEGFEVVMKAISCPRPTPPSSNESPDNP